MTTVQTVASSPSRSTGHPLVLALLVLLALLLPACSSAADPTGATGPDEADAPDQGGVTIVISEFSYQVPASVPAGAGVTVRNEDQVGHTVTSDESGIFDVAVGPGEETTFTAPEEPGEYPFHCIPHPQMTATLVVQD